MRDAIASFIKKNVPVDSDGQLGRAAKRFGLIAAAGELATEFGVTGWERGQSTAAAAQCLARWKKTRGGDGKEPAEDRRAILHISRFIVQYGDSRFDELNEYGYPVALSVDAEGRPSGVRSAQRAMAGAKAPVLIASG
ncbi:hypothetical protein [Methylocystis parvus]|uniref:hypothetical protein n=1 Tax=Methylocystis parvus TaxID=134 RepID=UPI003C734116